MGTAPSSGEVKPLAAPPTSNPPTQPFKPLSPPRYLPLLQAYQTGPESWWGTGRETEAEKARASKFKRGGGRESKAKLRGGDSALVQGVSLPSRPGEPLLPRPSGPLHLPGQLGVSNREGAHPRPASARALTDARAHAATLARFSPTLKFIHKTLRLSQPKGGEPGRGGESISVPPPPRGVREPGARPESATASIPPYTRWLC